jgi:glycosyltransferase involved in cell wall biosynthesis
MVVDEDRAAWRGSVRSGGPRRRLAPASARCSDRPIPGPDDPLRICFLVYRGNPHCGGQGVYTRHLTRELARLGHDVEVLAGPPYPVVDEPVRLTRLRGIDFYGGPEPMSRTAFLDVRTGIDLLEYLMVCTAAFPEPLCFSLRAWRHLIRRPGEFDIVHDNQCLAWGLLGIERHPGIPVVATLHHPVTVDRELELRFAPDLRRQVSLRRFYSFLRMQRKVSPRLRRIITVSESSRGDIADQMGVPVSNMAVVPVGVDQTVFRPRPGIARVPGRIMTTASADVPLKGLRFLLEAVARLGRERQVELVVVGRPRSDNALKLISQLGIGDSVRFVHGIDDNQLVGLYAEAEAAVVPSLYEGFSLPAIEAMACGVPVIGTTGGAIPEVVGADGDTGLLVPPGKSDALASAIGRVLGDGALQARLGDAGRARVIERFTWQACAVGTIEQYRATLEPLRSSRSGAAGRSGRC